MTPASFAKRFPSASAIVQQGIARNLHHGAQIYISRNGEVLADVGIGMSSPDVPMTDETVSPWLSAGKPLTAVLVAQLQEAGQLHWDDTVARFIPEFGNRGKEEITIRYLLTHTAGLGTIDSGWPEVEWHESIQRICAATLDPQWVVGQSAGYDPSCGWFLLGEIVQRLTGTPFAEALHDRLLQPLEMLHTWAAMTDQEFANSRGSLGWMWERQRGQLVPSDWHESPRCTRASPGNSLRGPIRELGRFYESLQNPTSTVVSPETIRLLTSRQRVWQFDQTFGHIIDFGLGFLIDSNRYGAETVPYGYGRDSSPRTFGHGGSQCSQGFCDPQIGLVIAYVFNGRPGEGQHQRRIKAFNEAVYQDLTDHQTIA